MAHVVADRVRETTTTTGTGTYTLAGAVTGFETFGSIGNSNTTYYCCTDGTNFEVGVGTYTSSGTTLARTTILQSSNSDNAVNWSSGTRQIFCTLPAEKAVIEDASNNVAIGGELSATSLDISGNIDVDGITNVDELDVDAGANFASYIWQSSDGAVHYFGGNYEVRFVHNHNRGLKFYNYGDTSGDDAYAAYFTFANVDGSISTDQELGAITFEAPLEASGTDAVLTAGFIKGVAENAFSSSSNAMKLSFGTASSEAATEKMSLSSGGNLTVSGDITAKTSDGAILKLQTSDTTVQTGDILGAIEFSSPDEASGGDSTLKAAAIEAVADPFANFGTVVNSTDLVFKLGDSEAATEKMRLTHEGNLSLKGASAGAYLRLNRDDTTVVDGNVIGGITFTAHNEASGTDAITTAASITAEADATFSSSNNKTDLVFKLGESGAASESMRLEHEGNLIITADSADANGNPTLNLYRNSSSPADNDNIGKFVFSGRNDNSQDVDYFMIKGLIADASDGSEDGKFELKAQVNGNNTIILSSSGTTLTATGEIAAASLDISGDVDVDGTLEADAMTLNGTAITTTATLSTGISNNNVPKFTSGVADNDFLRVDGTAIEGRSASEVLSDIGGTTASDAANEATALAIALG